MKIKEYIFILIIFLFGCKSNLIDPDAFAGPRIIFMVDSLLVDLNTSIIPEIVSVVQSEAGLSSVTFYVIKSEKLETMYENSVTTFSNSNSFSSSKMIPYTEDVVGFKVKAVDKVGHVVSSTLPIKVVPLREAPVVKFKVNDLESIIVSYREGEPMPIVVINASSEDYLRTFAVSKVVNRTESPILIEGKDTIKFVAQEKSYQTDLSIDGYQFEPNTTALKVHVSAGEPSKLKTKVATLKVDYVEIPGPEVTFLNGNTVDANEFTDVTISGIITAEAKLTNIKLYRKKVSGNILIDDINLSPSQSSYSFSVLLNRVLMEDQGIIVQSIDENNKTTTFTCTLNVIEVAPAPSVMIDQALDAFNGVDDGQSISLTGNISTVSGFQTVDFVIFDNAGAIVQRNPIAFTNNNITLNSTWIVTNSTRKVGIEVVDLKGKSTSVYRDVHVGYYYVRVLMSMAGEDTKATSTTGPLPGPFFSAKHRRAMSYIEGKAAPMECDIAFHAQSSHGAVRCGNMTYARGSSKFVGHIKTNASLDTWEATTNYIVKTITTLNYSEFDETTISQFEGLTFTGTSESPVIASGPFPNPVPVNIVVGYQTLIDNQPKNVIFIYDSFDNMPADKSASTFFIKIKIQK